MDRQILNFTANEQILVCDNPIKISTNKVNYIEARFDLGQNWTGYDSVRAVWFNDFQCISTVLDSQGVTFVPFEVMKRRGNVKVNLVGSISENDVLTDRLTSYPVVAVIVDCIAQITGANTSPITPSEYEQFVASVRNDADRAEQGASDAETYANNAETSADNSLSYSQNAEGSAIRASGYALDAQGYAQNAETAKDEAEDARDEIRNMSANATTLPAGSSATASYSDGVLSLGIPRGDTGATGAKGDTGATPNLTIGTVETLEPTESATATITGTDENPVLNLGLPKGEQGEVSLDELSALLPTDTASGDIASFPDGQSIIPAVSVKAQIEPIQSGSGTPSPDNVRPISGHTECVTEVCGVNLFDKTTAVDGYIDDANGQLSGSEPYKSTDYIRVVGGNSYYIASEQTASMWGAWYDENKRYISGVTSYANQVITAPSNASFVRLTIKSSATGNVDTFAVNYPSTDHDYHAYNGNTYTTDLGRTVYGGTLEQVGGQLTDRMAIVDASTLTFAKYGAYNVYYANVATKAEGVANIVSDMFAVEEIAISSLQNGQMRGSVSNKNIYVGSDKETLTDFNAWVNENKPNFCYELATPQTYQLDPQTIDLLLGQNNLWTDCGAVEVTYKADVGLYIDKKLSNSGTRSLSMGLTKSATVEAETETEPSKTEADTKAEETKTEEVKTELSKTGTDTETR